MIKPIQAILYILRGNITLDGKTVPVIKRNYPLDKTPCINIDDSASITTLGKRIYNRTVNNEKKEYLRTHRRTILNIHCWIDNENQREELCNKVTDLFNKAYLDHHMFCTQYDKETMQCTTLNETCPTINQGKHLYKSSKNKCPQPTEYGYTNIFTRYDLIKRAWDLQAPYSNDNTSTKPPTLHSVFRLNCEYYDYVEIGGITIKDMKYYGEKEREN